MTTNASEPLYLGESVPTGWVLEAKSQRGDFGWSHWSSSRMWKEGRNYGEDKWRIRNVATNETRPVVFEERPVREESIDWSRFLPEIGSSVQWTGLGGATTNAVFLSVDGRGEFSVRRLLCTGGAERLAGSPCWLRRADTRLIRHADGRWADGYGPDGPIAQPAARPLAEGWERLKEPGAAPSFAPGYGKYGQWACSTGSHGYPITPALFAKSETLGACESCAERAGVFADVAVAEKVPLLTKPSTACGNGSAGCAGPEQPWPCRKCEVPIPSPPSCNWTCSREHGTHGPRCAQYVPPGTMAPTPLAMRIVGEYQSGGDGLRLLLGGEDLTEFQSWAAEQRGLPSGPRPRIRGIYVEGDGADPDYTGTEVR